MLINESIKRKFYRLGGVTFDPDNTYDSDDAIYLEKKKYGYKAIITIGDVDFYIQKGCDADLQAGERLESKYEPMRVDMINNASAYSLKPGKECPGITCEINYNSYGNITDFTFYLSNVIVNSEYRYNKRTKKSKDLDLISKKILHIGSDLLLASSNRMFKRLEYVVSPLVTKLMTDVNQCASDYLVKKNYQALYRHKDERNKVYYSSSYLSESILNSPKCNISAAIRSYRDLVTLRVLKYAIENLPNPYTEKELDKICEILNRNLFDVHVEKEAYEKATKQVAVNTDMRAKLLAILGQAEKT